MAAMLPNPSTQLWAVLNSAAATFRSVSTDLSTTHVERLPNAVAKYANFDSQREKPAIVAQRLTRVLFCRLSFRATFDRLEDSGARGVVDEDFSHLANLSSGIMP